ncbi:MAG: hypothetical protein ASARMPRED_004297 [Alectoria sarmentosa]|nr:MAG: hypothetical protein ASARMPRED_004297 [Alectoria sarmentosa]
MSCQPRLIDTLPSHRTLPMKVIVLGLNRTGTMSLFTALQTLHYRPYHGTDMWADPARNLTLWTEAMRAKFMDEGEKWGRRELDVMLGDFDAVLDLPAACMVSELVTAYPTAKFILTHRPVNAWLASMNATIFPVMGWRSWRILRHLDRSFVAPWWAYKQAMLQGWGGGDFGDVNMTRTFLKHNERVRKVVPQGQLLEFDVKEGWAPLCRFLGVERPEGAFPHVNDSEAYILGAWAKAHHQDRMGKGVWLDARGEYGERKLAVLCAS